MFLLLLGCLVHSKNYKIRAIRGECWLKVLSDLQSSQLINEQIALVLGLLPFHPDVNRCIENISKNPGLSLLLVDSFSELLVLHNLYCLSANFHHSDPKLVALSGDGAVADCHHIEPVSPCTDLEFSTPAWCNLKNVANEEALKNLLPPDQATTLFKGKQVMLVPPLVSITILETKSLALAILILALSAKFQEFDGSSATVKAYTILRPALKFLWAVYHKKVPASIIGLDQSQDVKNWSKKIHLSNIVLVQLQMGPPHFVSPPPVPPPQDQSSMKVGELHLLRDVMERQHLHEISNEEEKKNSSNGWEKTTGGSSTNGVTFFCYVRQTSSI